MNLESMYQEVILDHYKTRSTGDFVIPIKPKFTT